MMNSKLITSIVIFCSLNLFAQENQIPVNEKTGMAEYTEVIEAPGVSAGELYERADLWINNFFPNPAGAVDDRDSAVKISGKAQFRLTLTDKDGNTTPAGFVVYSFSIEFKDGKYRYIIDRIHQKASSYFDISRWEQKDDAGYKPEVYPAYVEQTVKYFNEMIESLVEALDTPIEVESTDW